jgi:anaerobic selenocysteine-containing dehydrogenase
LTCAPAAAASACICANGEVRYIEGNIDHPLNKGVICAKGSSGIMKQYSPARLTEAAASARPGPSAAPASSRRFRVGRGLRHLAERLGKIRATDPKKFALFTGRDQMQALTGMFARQFGTPNYAAHGGFCSVNMAAGMIYTIGGSFWEFGGPDLDRAKLFVMIGTAEDHHSNPLKIALSKFKRDGGRFISINPVRTGYSAIADEWVPIKPRHRWRAAAGVHPRDHRHRPCTTASSWSSTATAGQLNNVPKARRVRLFRAHRSADRRSLLRAAGQAVVGPHDDSAVVHAQAGRRSLPARRIQAADGTPVKPAFQLLQERVKDYTPEWASQITGIPAETIRAWRTKWASPRATRRSNCRSPGPIPGATNTTRHRQPGGLPRHARPGGAFSNGFQTIRAMAILMSLLGTIDRPGGFRHKAPFPRPIPPCARTPNDPARGAAQPPLDGMALGWPADPDDLFVNDDGSPVRIDKAFSWEYPLSVHGLMHNAITNAWRGDPYRSTRC